MVNKCNYTGRERESESLEGAGDWDFRPGGAFGIRFSGCPKSTTQSAVSTATSPYPIG